MTDNKPMENEELEEDMVPVFTLTDDEGNEQDFELLAETTIDGKLYYALAPLDEESEEYVILSVTEEGEELFLETIDNDDEFEKVEDYFNDLFMSEIDYDN
jgi:uncharacterized protein YrzB (UPF0473 family)